MSELDSKISKFFEGYHSKHCAKGEVLLFPGDNVQYIYFIVSGSVKQYSVSKQGEEVVLNIFKPGAFFPMANVMNDTSAKYMVEIEAEAEIRVVPKGDALGFIKDNPDVLYDLLSRVYRGTEGLLGKLEHLMVSSAEERFVYELITEAQRFGEQQPNGEVTVGLNESAIAQRAGLSRETVNRQIRKLKDKNLVRIERNKIVIISLDQLQNLLDS